MPPDPKIFVPDRTQTCSTSRGWTKANSTPRQTILQTHWSSEKKDNSVTCHPSFDSRQQSFLVPSRTSPRQGALVMATGSRRSHRACVRFPQNVTWRMRHSMCRASRDGSSVLPPAFQALAPGFFKSCAACSEQR